MNGTKMKSVTMFMSQRLHQHSIGYLGDGFTGRKTQPTVSKY